MSKKLASIPVVVASGQKYRAESGAVAVKDGIKAKPQAQYQHLQKPEWLKIKVSSNKNYLKVKALAREAKLSTVCEEAKCPNISECWAHGTATFMLMGAVCTRACRFCSVDTGNPHGWLDHDEPEKTAIAIVAMKLQYAVLTSVDRDDLPDGGAAHFARTITCIKAKLPRCKVEALTPDFKGNTEHLMTLLDSKVDVFAQNVETVERLTHPIRDNRAGYWQTLDLLGFAKQYRQDVITKTSLMLGLGETEDELKVTMDELREKNVDVLTLGQYLQPTKNHYPITRYVSPEEFALYRQWGLERGFMEVASGPLVRSSYRADRIFTDENLGL